jgi:hypothetical protein
VGHRAYLKASKRKIHYYTAYPLWEKNFFHSIALLVA